MARITHEQFEIFVHQDGARITSEFNLEKSVKRVKGISVSSDYENLLYHRGRQSVTINKREIFGERFESKRLWSDSGVAVNNRFYTLEEFDAGNGTVRVVYKDTNHNQVPFAPYTVTYYFLCESPD